jgi:hypothetical protein
MISWDMGESHIFQTLFAFLRIFKSFRHTIMVVFLGQDVWNFFWFHENILNGLSNMYIIFTHLIILLESLVVQIWLFQKLAWNAIN